MNREAGKEVLPHPHAGKVSSFTHRREFIEMGRRPDLELDQHAGFSGLVLTCLAVSIKSYQLSGSGS